MVESLVAIGLFGIAALGITGLFAGLMTVGNINAHHTTATELAQEELEDLRSLSYADISSRTNTATVNGITYTIGTTVQDDTPVDNTKTIAVTVSWVGQANVSRQFSLDTIYAEVTP
jgi:type II secretory pathway pseudopilin PulG